MKTLKIYQVDVFTNEYYKGNPAAVCLLDSELKEEQMKSIAGEMNLSETAFVLAINKESNIYSLRWFTPEVEVPLCGHGTIGTAKVLFEILKIESDEIFFETKSGRLVARRYENGIGIDMPLDKYEDISISEDLLSAIGIERYMDAKIGKVTRKLIIRVDNEDEILNLKPDFSQMKKLKFKEDIKGVAITSNNTQEYDFLSRYFNPWAGIDEDPVTGSVHTVLAQYWGEILKQDEMIGYQASSRGGKLLLRIKSRERLEVIGDSVIVLEGDIYLN